MCFRLLEGTRKIVEATDVSKHAVQYTVSIEWNGATIRGTFHFAWLAKLRKNLADDFIAREVHSEKL